MDVVHVAIFIKLESQTSEELQMRTCNTLGKSCSYRRCHIHTDFLTVSIDNQSNYAILPSLLTFLGIGSPDDDQ